MPFTGGNEVTVNQVTNLAQSTSSTNSFVGVDERPKQAIAVDANGNIIVTWSSLGQDVPGEVDRHGIYARRYDATTGQWGSEFLVNRDTTNDDADQLSGNQTASAVAMDDTGNFIITWSSEGVYQVEDNNYGIYAQRYDSSGNPLGDPFIINTTTVADQTDAAVAMDADGDFVVAWTSRNQDSSGSRGIFVRRFNQDGTFATSEIQANTHTTEDQIHASVAMDADGNFVVVWQSNAQDGDSWGIYGQRFSANGDKLGSEFQINTSTARAQQYANVSMDTTGNFVVTWTSNDGVLNGNEIYARRYNSSGTALGSEFKVNQTTTGSQQYSNIKVLDNGGFIITWTATDGTGTGIYGRRYGANGLPLAGADGDEFLINSTQAGNQNFASVGADQDGNFSVAWTGNPAGTNDVYARTFTVTQAGNNPPTDIALSSNSINENVPANSIVGSLSTIDPDDPGSSGAYAYALVVGQGDNDNSAFTIVNNELRINQSPDFETKSTYSLRVQTTDAGGLSYEKILTVNIINLNEAPTDIVLSKSNINENVTANSEVGQLSTLDPDAGNTFSYSLVTGTGSTDNASFSISGNKLLINVSPNFEAKPSYSIRIRATDQAGASVDKILGISVNDLNEAPTNITLSSSSINENVPANSTVGSLSTVDPDVANTFTYQLVTGTGSTDNAAFTIVNNELRINTSPDFETKNSYSIRVRTTDQGNLSFEKVFTININDLNDPPTNFAPTDLNISSASVNENVAANSAVGLLSTVDPNTGDTFTYQLVSGTGSTDNAAFTIVNNELRINASPDFEAKSSYSIRVRTTDAGGLSFEKALTITINDLNEAPTDIILNPSSIDENVPAGSLIANLNTIDLDAGDTFTYALVSGAGSTDNSAFTLTSAGGLSINSSPDFETKSDYSIRVRVTDRNSTGLSFEKVLLVSINDVAEAGSPTDLVLSNSELNENSPANSVIGTLITTDDSAGPFTYTLDPSFGDAANFTINGSNQLVLTSIANYEVKPTYSIRVRTTDPDGLSLTKVLTITVKDVNEAPFDLGLSNATIDENSPANSVVGLLLASDPDAGDTFTYSLVTGTGSTDNSAFTIVNNELQINAIPNFEAKPTYSIRVRTTDKSGLFFEKVLTVNVRDINDAPTDIGLSNNLINENVPANSVVGTLSTTDSDASETFTYSLVSGSGSTDNAAFAIVGNQLQIRNSPDFETKSTYSIRVRSTDKAGLSFEKVLIVNIGNVNEAPTNFSLSTSSIDENRPANSTVGTFSTTDPDPGDTFTYALVTGTGSTDNSAFTIVNNELRINSIPDFETKSSYSIRVRTTDRNGLSFEKTFTVTVNNLSELPGTTPPRDISLSNNRVTENQPANTLIGTLSSTDPDVGDTFTYSLVTGTGSTDNSAFTIVNNELRIKSPADFETKPTYSIRVQTRDSGGLTFEKVFTISVNDLPEGPGTNAPTDLLLSRTSIDENVPGNTAVGTFTTIDPDQGDTFTYSLQSGFGDNASFRIVGNELQVINSPDFETKPSYSIRVTTTDVGGKTFTKTFTISVNNINDPPVITPSTGGLTYVEGSGNVAIDPAVLVADLDSPNLTSAAVRIVGYVPGQDSLSLTPPTGITANFDTATGVLSLTGSAALSAYQTALRSVTYNNSSKSPNTGTRTIEFTARDATSTSRVASRTIQIIAIDTVPVVTTSTGALAYQENAGEKTIDAGVIVQDEDSSALTGATVRIGSYVRGQDFLGVTTPSGISSNFDAATGILTLTGSASPASYQAALRSVTYLNTSSNPSTAARTIQFSVRDATSQSNLASRSVQVTAINTPPAVTASSGGLAYPENAGAVAIDAQIRVVDADSPNLTGATVTLQGYVAAEDSLTFTPQSGITSNFNAASGVLSFTGSAPVATYQALLRSVTYANSSHNPTATARTAQFTVQDSSATSNLAARSIQVIPVNDAPVLKTSVQEISLARGTILIDPLLTLTDVDNNRLTGATVTIGNYVSGEDRLLFKEQDGITGNFDPTTGVLRLTGNAAVSSYQTVLRKVQYNNNQTIPTAVPRILEIRATDGAASSDLTNGRVQVNFIPTGIVPTIDLNGTGVGVDYSNTYVMGGAPISIVADDARFTNQTYPVLTSAKVTITNLLNGANEKLSVNTGTSGIAANYDANQGVLTLSGTAPLANYLQVLRSVQYENTSSAIDTTTRSILFTVSNGTNPSEPAQTRVQISQIRLATGTVGTNGSLITTPSTDLIDAADGDDSVLSTLDNLQQNDSIAGGTGRDTFTLTEGGETTLALLNPGNALVEVDNPVNQLQGILLNNTVVHGFEVFRLTGFTRNATLLGSDQQDDTLSGGSGNDIILGKAGNDVLSGSAGDDQLDGGIGDDLLEGGPGNDLYVIGSIGDWVIEAFNAGFDTVQAGIDYTLGNDLEALTLTGSAVVGNGNALDNQIRGNTISNRLNGGTGDDLLFGGDGRDELKGGVGNDRLIGERGRDRLVGGKGKDRFVLTEARKKSLDTIKDFRSIDDTIDVVRSGFSRTLKLGKIRRSQFRLGSEALDRSDRFIYNRKTGALFFDADGLGGIAQVQVASLANKATLGRADIVVTNGF